MTYRLMDLVADQERRCQQGDLMLLEAYLAAYPGLEEDTDTVIELLLREYRLRRESGESPTLAEYIRRFPQYDEILRRQFALVEALEAACAVRQA
jgi:hypothetical protein